MPVDFIEVTRAAYQLSLDQGLRAHVYAAKLATAAREKMLPEDEEFWSAVAVTLQPRTLATKTMQLETCIAPKLKILGFRKKGRTWWRSTVETIGVINIQKSPYGTRIYINLGVYVKQLGQEERPSENHCHVRARLEQVASDCFWNEIVAAESTVPPSASLLEAIAVDGVAWLNQLSTLDGIRDHIKAGGADAVVSVKKLVDEFHDLENVPSQS